MAVNLFRVQAYRYPSGISDDDVLASHQQDRLSHRRYSMEICPSIPTGFTYSIEIFSLKTRIVFPIPATTADDCIRIKKTISEGDNDGGGW